MGNKILLNSFDVNRRSLVTTNGSGEGFGHILMQKKNKNQFVERAKATNSRTGEVTSDIGWVVMQFGSAAMKPAWRNYSALELQATCVVWTLETWANYLKGCPEFDLWTIIRLWYSQ